MGIQNISEDDLRPALKRCLGSFKEPETRFVADVLEKGDQN
jgi:hypothetical protein